MGSSGKDFLVSQDSRRLISAHLPLLKCLKILKVTLGNLQVVLETLKLATRLLIRYIAMACSQFACIHTMYMFPEVGGWVSQSMNVCLCVCV
jgi:hypothetical protein